VNKELEKKKQQWAAMRKFKALLAAYDLPTIPNPEKTKKISEKV